MPFAENRIFKYRFTNFSLILCSFNVSGFMKIVVLKIIQKGRQTTRIRCLKYASIMKYFYEYTFLAQNVVLIISENKLVRNQNIFLFFHLKFILCAILLIENQTRERYFNTP